MGRKLFPLLLAAALLLPAGCGRTEEAVCYYASAQGNNGLLTISASFTAAGEITVLEVVEHGETPGICDEAITAVPARILESQSLDVETVSGATATSRAIMAAAEKAVLKAGLSPEDYSGGPPRTANPSREADVVVVGGGAAGFAAAAAAMERGCSVILVEKMPAVGGNSLHSGGAFNVVDPEKQAEQGGVDSLELFVQQTWEVGGGRGDRTLVRLLGEQSKSAYEWLKDYGAVWNETFVKTNGGLWPRSLEPDPSNTAGDIFLYNLQDALLAAGNTVLTDTRAERLIKENGVVTGVLCLDVNTQSEVIFRANKGVVLATGGYAANTEMLNKFNITLPLTSSSQPSNTGDGILMAMEAGAALVDMDKVQLHPSGNPRTGELQFHLVGESIRTINVNIFGNRFVNEEADWGVVTSAVLAQPNKVMYVIMDSKQTGVYNHFEQDLNSGDLLMGDSLAELAHKMGMEAETLEQTVAAYNNAIARGTTDPFGKTEREPIDVPPYFATLRAPVIHYTLGGILIDAGASALDGKGEPIPGLFAAGEVTGGIHGENRLCGNSLTEAVVFGRIAGESAAAR